MAILSALLAVAASGCVSPSTAKGDAPATAPDTTVALSADQAAVAQYVRSADDVCEQHRTAMAANLSAFEVHKSVSGRAKRKTVKLAKPEEVALYIKGQLSHLVEQQAEVAKLELPEGATGTQISELWKRADVVIAEVEKDPTAVAYSDPFRDVAKQLKAIGFTECFQPERPTNP